MRINRGNHVQQTGHHDEARAVVANRNRDLIGAQTEEAGRQIEQAIAQIASQAQQVQHILGAHVELALHCQAQSEHAQDRQSQQGSASPLAQQKMPGARNQPARNERQINKAACGIHVLLLVCHSLLTISYPPVCGEGLRLTSQRLPPEAGFCSSLTTCHRPGFW